MEYHKLCKRLIIALQAERKDRAEMQEWFAHEMHELSQRLREAWRQRECDYYSRLQEEQERQRT